MLSLPAMILGLVVLLPSSKKALGVSTAGAVITVGATVGFVIAYPDSWNFMGETDYTVEVTATYAVGLAGLTASTGAALIAHYLDMAREADRVMVGDDDEPDESYTDEEIQSDIDAAMEDVELSWGGVQKTEHKRLSFSENEFDEVDVDSVGTTTTRSSGVDAQVAGLKGLKGGDTKTTTSSATVDDQTQKLKELREQQRAEELATDDGGIGDSVTGILASLRNRLRRN